MRTIRNHRVRRAIAVAAVSAAVVGVSASCASEAQTRHDASYCAFLPDTIGLYADNPVTQMGYQIGKITGIQAGAKQVRVDFTLSEQRELPSDVKAIIRSPSILADRSLELVGNYAGGPRMDPTGCIPLDRSVSPKSLSEVIGSADTFINAINDSGSTNVADTIRGVDHLAHNNGVGVGQLLTLTSSLLDSPDQSISDIGSIVGNAGTLTTALKEIRGPLKEILMDAPDTTVDAAKALDGAQRLAGPRGIGRLGPLIEAVAVVETRLGDETQITLDTVSAALRKTSPHANALASLFNGVPWWINTAANHFNAKQFGTFNIAYRPPLFRVATHDGLALCGAMNASMPGSCADVNGQPYAVDIALLQYVLQQASHQ
ncbi:MULTISPECIES: MlaD family protein [unclassified Mycolicibacterium]|uniref:MlaD family protein n=1 Tax=unclassified Mycolicibacterium TaxID=2636767 RepID=UPI0012DC282D|nr:MULTISPECIES: MlaD family protein [unclassified Mycolicibacterium]MUL82309.1 MCE family protein [Mycolicibacterium sp. CBMA 329]MUL88075.1 MCE family protein [Mycolicibacterium sp. CBMA 331]MUM02405.1 MCE family protein [Mycolicibacterium sp. CBMA 334]MUM24808.1 MCE family protein [Mycolicibacterium sp. CBMA 295]MUM38372.1 MCE family protein [Mycolicibacterium sp. CBMA 247]